jgi:hypothetical protein
VTISATTKRTLRYSLAASLLLSCAPAALHAETSEKDAQIRKLESMMLQMQSQIRSLKAAVGETRAENKRTREKVREVASKGYALPPPTMAIPAGATPAFVTADKKLQFGALTITPGGFVAMESAFRTRTEQADIASQYQGIPFGPQAGTNELRFSARQSRAALLVEGAITPSVLAAGYGEFDFLGSGVTSNSNESNSYVPRIRHLYGTLDFADYGVHVLAGQTWSLATLNSKGITPRNEVTPPTIDAQYVPGFVWKRQPQIRLTKDFGQKLWLSLAAEAPQDTYTGCAPGVNGTAIATRNTSQFNVTNRTQATTCDLLGNNNLNGVVPTVGGVAGTSNTTAFSLNHVPDIIGKAAYEAKLADRDVHLEGFGMYRDLYDRVSTVNTVAATPAQPLHTTAAASNFDSTGYGVGGSVIAALLPKKLDFQASVMTGRGIGSYGTAQFTDATFSPNGQASPLKETMLLGGLTAHVTPAIDVYAFGGEEVVQPDYYRTTGNGFVAAGTQLPGYAGYGAPTANNTGCFNTIAATTFTNVGCAGNAKRVWQITGGMWDKLYKGSFGEVRVGVQYSYTQRELFAGSGSLAAGNGQAGAFQTPFRGSPHQNENTILTSLRYYPFQ